jgi:D-beta-D-heptose 7-phosphate kinase/D-beta-D-heptose 1-phosphate adenosyltransferase
MFASAMTEPPRILVVGDVMLDRHVFCEVTGISPEDDLAPKLIKKTESHKPGGAANVVDNLEAMGADAVLLGVVGDDPAGRILQSERPYAELVVDNRTTTTKTRYITTRGRHVARVDKEQCDPISGDTLTGVINFMRGWVKHNPTGIIVVSDYEKGVVCEDVMDDVVASQCPYIVGAKVHNLDFYGRPDVLVYNALESSRATSRGHSEWIVVTKGKDGCVVKHGKACEQLNTNQREVGDPTGCGDSFLAAFSIGYALKWPMPLPARLGNAAGAVAYDHIGVHSVTAYELLTELDRFTY